MIALETVLQSYHSSTMLSLPTPTGYAKGHANVFCIIKMHNVAKNALQRAMQTTMHFLSKERERCQIEHHSLPCICTVEIFFNAFTLFFHIQCCNNVFSMRSHLQMQTGALCPLSRSTHSGRLEGSSSCSLLQLLMHLLPLAASDSSMVMTSGLRADGRKGCWP
jgi:hypothetical protein